MADRVDRLSRVAMIPAAPLLWRQARQLRRDTPILPPTGGPWEGEVAGPDPIRLLVLGDSTAAGVGVTTQDEGLPGHLSRALVAATGRGVRWKAIGRSGATARDLLAEGLLPDEPADLVFLTIGANDALGLRTTSAFARDLRTIIDHLRTLGPETRVLMSSLPMFHLFALLPEPLRSHLRRHSLALESAGRRVVAGYDNAHMSVDPPPYTDGFFASDDFHPSASGYRDWAGFAVADAAAAGLFR